VGDWDVIHSSESMEWRTPPELFRLLDGEVLFDVDAASSPANALCDHYWTADDDALSIDWSRTVIRRDGTPPHVFLNPPYGRNVGKWIDKAIEQQAKGCTVVMVLMACTDTKWWAQLWGFASEVRFLTGRVKFLDADGHEQSACPKGTAIVVLRPFGGGREPKCSLVRWRGGTT
jgi:site-specific DNA-methyltransferase (adenine-specific)